MGLVLELGRKIRVPRLEQEGVETYSALWGTANSVAIWLVSVAAAVVAYANAAALITSSSLHFGLGAAIRGQRILSIIGAFCSGDFALAHRSLSRGEPMSRGEHRE